MPFVYVTVDTSTVKGIKKAERLQALGYKIIQTGLYTLLMEKRIAPKGAKP